MAPPPQQSRLLSRQRLDLLLASAADYPLTLIVAPAGSGKTTALAGLASRGGWPMAWCRMSADDTPISLLRHLAAAFGEISGLDQQRIHMHIDRMTTEAAAANPQHMLDLLVNDLAAALNDETLLVLDDYHCADQHPALRALIDRFITIQPGNLHLLLSTRYEPELASLATARARGEVNQIGQADLAFTVEETQALFDLYECPASIDVAELTAACRGWPLALQALAADQAAFQESKDKVLGEPQKYLDSEWYNGAAQGEHTSDLFPNSSLPLLNRLMPLLDSYLGQQVFDDQPPQLQKFLLYTARLRWIDEDACAALVQLAPLQSQQAEVERRCLFLELTHTGHLTYQPLFKAFLERQAVTRLMDQRDFHRRAAEFYRDRGDDEGVIHHLLAIGESAAAAEVLKRVARDWLKQGRAAALLAWLDRLPEEQQRQPELLEALAAANHRLGQFEQALQIYQQAETAYVRQGDQEGRVRSLRGRAEIYLDTVQPALAEELLEQVLDLLPQERYAERAEILRLQAENWANRGRADVALTLETSASELAQKGDSAAASEQEHLAFPDPRLSVPSPAASISPRLLLRSGRLHESRLQLETTLHIDTQHLPEQRVTTFVAHREPLLLLGLIYAMLGQGPKALAMARRGLLEAQQNESHLTEAIAHMRVGHAYQVIAPLDVTAANQHYQQALELAHTTGVVRTKAEVYLGLTLLQGHNGDLGMAEASAREGLHIAEAAGDDWTAALIWLALGGAAVAISDKQAPEWLEQAQQRFIRGGDTYGQAVVALWLALWHLRAGNDKQTMHWVEILLRLARNHGYEGLLTSLTLFGPRDMAMLVPVLLRGRTLPDYSTYSQQLLRQAFPSIAADEAVEDYHPGYTLRVQMLGTFRVWRGQHEIQAREWQREKARQLFQLLLTYRGRWLQREQICALLWPDSDLDAAERQFKVTLNALNTALEPMRPPRTAPFFIRRQGLAYSFAPSYGCWIDVDEFELRTAGVLQNDIDFVVRNSQLAVQLYRGDYLAESLYDSWTLEERERLLARYLATATALANHLVGTGDTEQAVHLCEQVLSRDRCYEEAYQILMRAYARAGSRSQALRSYMRCVQALSNDLGIEPLPETTQLYESIKRNEKI